ncbi:MAG: tol-pal system protein YbgF [Methylococcales bacterium]|nr:tol-pal system protein YbgF [Methylococcales bacterium]
MKKPRLVQYGAAGASPLRYRSRPLALACCLALGVAAQACAQTVNPAGGNPPIAAQGNSAVMDMESRIEQLQNEVQQLRGSVEEQAQTIAELQRKLNNMYSDLDNRVQALTPAAPAQPQPPVGTAPAPAPASAPAAVPAPVAVTTQSAATAQSPAAVAGNNEKDRYQQAYDTLRNAHYDQAVQQFEALLADFPNGEYADNAQYWLGEAYGRKRDVEKAKAAFAKLVSKYPNSQKVPDALLKLGYIEYEQQNMAKSREYLNQVVKNYPDTPAGYLAAKKLAQLP